MTLFRWTALGAITTTLTCSATAALAQEPATAAMSAESKFVFNTVLFLVGGFLVMWMAAGFTMLEAGMVRSKNVATICAKNIGLYAIASLMFWLVGYHLMYGVDAGGWIGKLAWFDHPVHDGEDIGYAAASSDWYFQMVFCATAASIVSGTLAERIKLWPFLIFAAVLTGVIYPIQGAWKWGGGWLDELGFLDFAGSTLVHSAGGWAALVGVLILGARVGKYDKQGRIHPLPGSSMPLATLGTFILWLGWFGFNGGSQLALGTLNDAADVSRIFANTNTAAAAGVVTAMILTQILYKKVDLTMALNGALAGLVSITAEPLTPSMPAAVLIGATGAAIVVFAVPMLDKLRIDDVVGAIPVHLFCGIWGTLAVPLTNSEANFVDQIVGIAAIGIFVSTASLVVWLAIKYTFGLRVTEEDERIGLDMAELGLEAYPEFGQTSPSHGI